MRISSIILFWASLGLAGPSVAGESDVSDTVDRQHRALLALAPSALDDALDALIDEVALTRAVVGATPIDASRRKRLEKALGQIARSRYRKALRQHGARPPTGVVRGAGTSHRVVIRPGPAPDAPDFAVTVRTKARKMRVVDVYTDGVSLAKNYKFEIERLPRTPTTSLPQGPDVDALIARIERDAAQAD